MVRFLNYHGGICLDGKSLRNDRIQSLWAEIHTCNLENMDYTITSLIKKADVHETWHRSHATGGHYTLLHIFSFITIPR
jgi:hypothetical protein